VKAFWLMGTYTKAEIEICVLLFIVNCITYCNYATENTESKERKENFN